MYIFHLEIPPEVQPYLTPEILVVSNSSVSLLQNTMAWILVVFRTFLIRTCKKTVLKISSIPPVNEIANFISLGLPDHETQ